MVLEAITNHNLIIGGTMASRSSSNKMEYPLYPRDQFNAFLNSCVKHQKMSPPLNDSDIEKLQDLIFNNYGYLYKRDLYKRFFEEYGYELKTEQENLTAIFHESDIVETLDGTLFCRKYVNKNKGLHPVYGFTPHEKKKYDDARRKHGKSKNIFLRSSFKIGNRDTVAIKVHASCISWSLVASYGDFFFISINIFFFVKLKKIIVKFQN